MAVNPSHIMRENLEVNVSVGNWYQAAFPMLGLAVILFGLWWTRPRTKTDAGNSNGLSDAPHDALQRVLLEGRRRDALQIHKAFTPWVVRYPLYLSNGADVPVDIVGYNLNLLWDQSPVAHVEWRAPNGEASNGIQLVPNKNEVPAYTIQPRQPYMLTIPVNRRQIADLPHSNPKWGARGNVYLRYKGGERVVPYDFGRDDYVMDQSDWTLWASQ